ncbi:MAG: SpaA isopeptide-forming pilin-related protein, partial [Lachnospiraceae bacterium]|nr:SpaA isopeptide-forming pilin-related protein [Lachnospiraceae bacterium]
IKATTSDRANYAYSPMAAFVSFGTYTTEPTALTPATVNAKKTTIKIEKSSSETDGVVEIDKEVTYTVKTNIPYIADGVENVTYTITDTITGAEYSVDENNALTVTVKIGTNTPYTVTVNPQSNSFVLDLSTIAANRANANLPIEISYNAIVKSEIVENRVVPNDGTHTFTPATNTLYTGKITMTKQGETADVKLENAGFVIYRVDGDNTYYAMVEKDREKTNEYVVKSWTTELNTAKVDANLIMTDANGEAVVRGLDDSYTYKFKEIKAPEGYSVNTTDSTAEWTDPHNVVTASSRAGAASMTDTKLNALPSTGGIGTTIFTIGGCAIMIVAAGLFFATRRKTQK